MSRQLAAEGGLAAMPPVLHIETTEGGHGLDPLLRSVLPLAETVPVGPDDLGAIVFTSGSTGEPKGVMRSHRNLVENVLSHVRGEHLGPQDVRLGNTALHYISPNLFYPAACGCRIHLLTEQDVMFPEIVTEIMERERATTWASAATALRLMIERGDLGKRDLGSMRLVKSFGEPLSIELLRAVMAAFPQARVTSTYGSTEAPNIARFDAPRPLPADMRSVPLGCSRIRLRGEALRRGWRRSAGRSISARFARSARRSRSAIGRIRSLTVERRLARRPNSYRTGDLAYFEADRTLKFVGRKDHMVKLRGHRFDLGEVEAALRQHPAVRDAAAVVVQRADGEIGDSRRGGGRERKRPRRADQADLRRTPAALRLAGAHPNDAGPAAAAEREGRSTAAAGRPRPDRSRFLGSRCAPTDVTSNRCAAADRSWRPRQLLPETRPSSPVRAT